MWGFLCHVGGRCTVVAQSWTWPLSDGIFDYRADGMSCWDWQGQELGHEGTEVTQGVIKTTIVTVAWAG